MTGDAATNGPFNNTADANLKNWPVVMGAAQKLSPQYVLPGHGPAGGAEILTGQANFMVELRKAAADAFAKGKKLDDVVTMKDGKPAATSVTLPASAQHWVGGSLPTQMVNAYDEVSQNKPAGDVPHK